MKLKTYIVTVRLPDGKTKTLLVSAESWDSQDSWVVSMVYDYFGLGTEVDGGHELLNPAVFEVVSNTAGTTAVPTDGKISTSGTARISQASRPRSGPPLNTTTWGE
jgi:hypothetical protein